MPSLCLRSFICAFRHYLKDRRVFRIAAGEEALELPFRAAVLRSIESVRFRLTWPAAPDRFVDDGQSKVIFMNMN